MEPSRQLARALRQYRDAQLTLERARQLLHDTIARELDAGVRQADIARATGYTREHIRQITRDRNA